MWRELPRYLFLADVPSGRRFKDEVFAEADLTSFVSQWLSSLPKSGMVISRNALEQRIYALRPALHHISTPTFFFPELRSLASSAWPEAQPPSHSSLPSTLPSSPSAVSSLSIAASSRPPRRQGASAD